MATYSSASTRAFENSKCGLLPAELPRRGVLEIRYLAPSTGYMTSRPRNCYPSLLGVEANLQFTSLPCAQDTGGENPCIGTKNGLKLLIVGDSAVRLLVTLGARSAW